MKQSIYIGYDPREDAACKVAMRSIQRHLTKPIPTHSLVLKELIAKGLYRRPIARDEAGRLWDPISDAPMSTEHANARFLVPHLAQAGWALFMDGDMLVRGDLSKVFEGLDENKAVYCVKHNYIPTNKFKMDNQLQLLYRRKNWSSFMIFNCAHEANNGLTQKLIDTVPGRDLHRFCWLDDSEIGELDPKWNFLVGHSDENIDPVVVHFTEGTPDMKGYENVPYSAEWRAELSHGPR